MPAAGVRSLGDCGFVRPRLAVAALAAALLLGGCDKGSREDRFCGRLAKDHALLAVVPSDPAQLDAYVNRYRQLEKVAPLAISDEWSTITDLMEHVASTNLSDPAAADKLRDEAVAATRSVDVVRLYALKTCGVDLVLGTLAAPSTTGPGSSRSSTVPSTAPATLPPRAP